MNRYFGPAFAAALLIVSTGCASRHGPAADAATTATTSDAASSSSDDKTGTGHVSITGEYALEHDFVVESCQIAPPGDGLLAGYHMGVKSDGPPIALLSIALKDFAKDGRYEQAPLSREAAVGQAMRTGTMGPLTLMVMGDATTPLAFGQAPSSKLAITISNDGAKGIAEFTDVESQITAADINTDSTAPPHGKRVSGSVSWSCGSVGRIDPKMNDAVNGMFKKLMPPK